MCSKTVVMVINLHDNLALDLREIFCFVLSLSLEANTTGRKDIYSSSQHMPEHKEMRYKKNIYCRNIDTQIQTKLDFSEDLTVCRKTVGNLLWSYYRVCVRKNRFAVWQIWMGFKV